MKKVIPAIALVLFATSAFATEMKMDCKDPKNAKAKECTEATK